MAAINKSKGTTASERLLALLADRTFLTLWAYPNVFRDHGKELCDLLVVCGNHIIVFSDKSIEWPSNVSTELAWSRWYRRAIAKSSDQLHRAINWIKKHPDRLYLNAQCSERFPIDLPQKDKMQIHGVIVARGATRACFTHFDSGSGSLGLMPLICRTKDSQSVPPEPFFVGNPCPDDDDVYHILDDVTLRILLTELDTITDFTNYLSKRRLLIQNDGLLAANGEEDLLAIYFKDLNAEGEHDFVTSEGNSLTGQRTLVVEGGSYQALRKRGEYKRKKAADKISYVWDHLIESFAKNVIADTAYVVRGFEGYHEPSKRELALREMALVSRLERRTHGLAIKGAFQEIGTRDRFFRAMLPGPSHVGASTAFFLLLVKRGGALGKLSDEDYRRFRGNLALGYALNLLRHMPQFERVVGIATEGEMDGRYRSEDAIYAEQPEWTEERIAEVEDARQRMEIFKAGLPSELKMVHMRPLEYPSTHYPQDGGYSAPYHYVAERHEGENRQQRRARRAQARKRQRRR